MAREIPEDPFLVYDGECPFCGLYVAKSRFETRVGRPLRLIDARQDPDLVARLRSEGFDLERGMVLALDGRRHHGAAAMIALRAMSGGTGLLAGLARWFARSPTRVRLAYPCLRGLRRAALAARGVPRFPG